MQQRFKYPSTPHLPFSPGASRDDRVLGDVSHFFGSELIVTKKMDGENVTIYPDGVHARSLDSTSHPSLGPIKAIQARIAKDMREGSRFCGENLYARHTLGYEDLPDWFLLFSFWSGDVCTAWSTTQDWAEHLNLELVPVLWRGYVEQEAELWDLADLIDTRKDEGFVVRTADSFFARDFEHRVAKWVRPGHVQPDAKHWRNQPIVPNRLGPRSPKVD